MYCHSCVSSAGWVQDPQGYQRHGRSSPLCKMVQYVHITYAVYTAVCLHHLSLAHVCVLRRFSHVWLSASPWTVTHPVPLSMGFSRQEYCSGLLCLPPENLPNPGIEPVSPVTAALQAILYHWATKEALPYNTQCDQCCEILVRVQQIQILLLGTFLHFFSQIFSIQVSNLKMHTPRIPRADSNLNIRGLNCFLVVFPAGDCLVGWGVTVKATQLQKQEWVYFCL